MVCSVDMSSSRSLWIREASSRSSLESFGGCLTVWKYLNSPRKMVAACSANCAAPTAIPNAETGTMNKTESRLLTRFCDSNCWQLW